MEQTKNNLCTFSRVWMAQSKRKIDQIFQKLNNCPTKKHNEASSTREERVFSNTNIKHSKDIFNQNFFLIIITVPISNEATEVFFSFSISLIGPHLQTWKELFLLLGCFFTCCENFRISYTVHIHNRFDGPSSLKLTVDWLVYYLFFVEKTKTHINCFKTTVICSAYGFIICGTRVSVTISNFAIDPFTLAVTHQFKAPNGHKCTLTKSIRWMVHKKFWKLLQQFKH